MLKVKYFPISSYSKFVFWPQIRALSRNEVKSISVNKFKKAFFLFIFQLNQSLWLCEQWNQLGIYIYGHLLPISASLKIIHMFLHQLTDKRTKAIFNAWKIILSRHTKR